MKKIMCMVLVLPVLWAACGKTETLKNGKIVTRHGVFMLYPYNDSKDGGTSYYTMTRTTGRNGKQVWTISGSVTDGYEYGYAGLTLKPDEQLREWLRGPATQIKLRISGDGKEYRISAATEEVTDHNNYGIDAVFPKRPQEKTILCATEHLQQEPGWGVKVPFEKSSITEIKIQTIQGPHKAFTFSIHAIAVE